MRSLPDLREDDLPAVLTAFYDRVGGDPALAHQYRPGAERTTGVRRGDHECAAEDVNGHQPVRGVRREAPPGVEGEKDHPHRTAVEHHGLPVAVWPRGGRGLLTQGGRHGRKIDHPFGAGEALERRRAAARRGVGTRGAGQRF